MKKCQHCHQTNNPDALFCEHCGTEFKTQQDTYPITHECPHCHQEIGLDSHFCEYCGFNLSKEEEIKQGISCSSCHHVNESSALFCENCGTPLKLDDSPVNEEDLDSLTNDNPSEVSKKIRQQDDTTNSPPPVRQHKTPLSKNKKIGIGVGIFAVVTIIGWFIYMREEAKPLNQLDKIITAIEEENTNYMVKHMTSSNTDISFTAQSIKPMLDYFSSNQEALEHLQTELSYNGSYEGFYLTPNGKKALFFTQYDLGVETIDAVIETNTDNTTIYLDDDIIAVTEDDDIMIDINQLIPGTYHFKAIYEPEGTQAQEQEVTYNLIESEEPVIDLSFHLVKIPIKSNLQYADILVDNKKVGTLKNGEGTIGPLAVTDNMTVKLKNKDIETDEIPLMDYINDSDTETIYLNSEVAVEEDVLEGLTSFYDDFAKVVQSKNDYPSDAFAMSHFVQGRQNSAFSGIDDYIKWCRERSANNEYEGVNFDIDVTKLEPLKNQEYKINYSVTYNTTYPTSTKKDTRIETFDYSGATVQLQINESGELIHFAFVNMGDGGVKVSDNKANE